MIKFIKSKYHNAVCGIRGFFNRNQEPVREVGFHTQLVTTAKCSPVEVVSRLPRSLTRPQCRKVSRFAGFRMGIVARAAAFGGGIAVMTTRVMAEVPAEISAITTDAASVWTTVSGFIAAVVAFTVLIAIVKRAKSR